MSQDPAVFAQGFSRFIGETSLGRFGQRICFIFMGWTDYAKGETDFCLVMCLPIWLLWLFILARHPNDGQL